MVSRPGSLGPKSVSGIFVGGRFGRVFGRWWGEPIMHGALSLCLVRRLPN